MVTATRRPTPNHVKRVVIPAMSEQPDPPLNDEGWLRIDLVGDLEGHHILLDPDELTLGLLEDIETGTTQKVLTTLTILIVGGDLPKGTDRDGLRRLKAPEAASVVQGVFSALGVQKRR